MAIDCWTNIIATLADEEPQRWLLVGDLATAGKPTLLEKWPDARIEISTAEQLLAQSSLPVFDVAVLAGDMENVAKADVTRLLARLRDLHARHIFVLLPVGGECVWQQADLFALGFLRQDVDAETQLQLYRFELEHYKTTPDWLNSDYWANPELFDKYRW